MRLCEYNILNVFFCLFLNVFFKQYKDITTIIIYLLLQSAKLNLPLANPI